MARIEREHRRRLLAALPAAAVLALVLLSGIPDPVPAWLLLLIVIGLTLVAAWVPNRGRGQRLRAITNLLDALHEGDYGVRGAPPPRGDAHAAIVERINALAQRLQDEQRGMQESLQLLAKTLAALDGAVFAFEQDGRLRVVNPAGERLLAQDAQALLGRSADELGLAPLFGTPNGGIRAHAFPGQQGRWQIGHAALRSRSQAGRLLVVQPMERALRDEEAQAFRKLLRVLSHEINNSMAPIASMSDTLRRMLPADGVEWSAELVRELRGGLGVIEQRSEALQRFLGGYARLARLPPPQVRPLDIAGLCGRVHGLFAGARFRIEPGEPARVLADGDQIEQVLINLVRNALEADAQGVVVLRWRREAGQARIEVLDSGHGLPSSDSLFVPFFTTKPGGSGIGLVLSRQIVEAQGGRLSLRPRDDAQGAVADVVLPLCGAMDA